MIEARSDMLKHNLRETPGGASARLAGSALPGRDRPLAPSPAASPAPPARRISSLREMLRLMGVIIKTNVGIQRAGSQPCRAKRTGPLFPAPLQFLVIRYIRVMDAIQLDRSQRWPNLIVSNQGCIEITFASGKRSAIVELSDSNVSISIASPESSSMCLSRHS